MLDVNQLLKVYHGNISDTSSLIILVMTTLGQIQDEFISEI